MNVISFEGKSCERIRKFLDADMGNELPAETDLEVHRHLERCRGCAEELEARQRIKYALKRAINSQEPAPDDLRTEILKKISPESNRNYWWLAVAAALIKLSTFN